MKNLLDVGWPEEGSPRAGVSFGKQYEKIVDQDLVGGRFHLDVSDRQHE